MLGVRKAAAKDNDGDAVAARAAAGDRARCPRSRGVARCDSRVLPSIEGISRIDDQSINDDDEGVELRGKGPGCSRRALLFQAGWGAQPASST